MKNTASVFLFLGMALIGAFISWESDAQLTVPQSADIQIGGSTYVVKFTEDLAGPVNSAAGVELRHIASEVTCPVDSLKGEIQISADLSKVKQAKALVHETVHIAQNCDKRDISLDERVAQDLADLVNGPEGYFVISEFK